MALSDRLEGAQVVQAARRALGPDADAWIVGGAVRDAALDRPIFDLDLAVDAGEEEVARGLAEQTGGHFFPLSEEFATWRIAQPSEGWRIDVAPLRGGTIEEDLGSRDFTVNAIAVPLNGGAPVDPYLGAQDLSGRLLRVVGETAFADDPIRVLRAARIAAAVGLAIEPGTAELARQQRALVTEVSAERQFAELREMLAGPAPLRALELMDELGATASLLPELEALRGVEQNPYHHLDVHSHTLAVVERLLDVELDLERFCGEHVAAVAELLAEPLADDLDRRGALRMAALFHDLGKPQTRSLDASGRVLFMGHDRVGAAIVRGVCARLRTSRVLSSHLQLLTREHLRLGFMVHAQPLSRRAVYDYLVATDPAPVDVTLLTIADRLATWGPKTRQEAVDAHLSLAREMIGEGLRWIETGRPASPIAGDQLAIELGIEEGPELGRLLDEISAARFTGEVSTPEQAVELGRRLQATKPPDAAGEGSAQAPPE
jgi:poly(A) polymerase